MNIDYFMKKLPIEITREIFEFMYPLNISIQFSDYDPKHSDVNYNERYQIAMMNKKELFINGRLLSRIPKKNGKHRYYITTRDTQEICDECNEPCICYNYYSCGSTTHEDGYSRHKENRFSSIYIGKHVKRALLECFILPSSPLDEIQGMSLRKMR